MSRRSTTSTAPPSWCGSRGGVDAIAAERLACCHSREIPLAPFLERHGDTRFPDFARRLKCSACNSRDVEARPPWKNPVAPAGRSSQSAGGA
jgi:hypothetical protein